MSRHRQNRKAKVGDSFETAAQTVVAGLAQLFTDAEHFARRETCIDCRAVVTAPHPYRLDATAAEVTA